jgi:tetratricopeptide (TPR) repeat protein
VGFRQLVLVAVGVILVASLYLFGRTRFPEGKMSGMPQASQHAANAAQNTLSISTLLDLAKKTLNADELDSVNELTKQLDSATTAKEKEPLLTKLAEKWAKTANFIVAASYRDQLSTLTPTKKNLEETAGLYYLGMQNTGDSLARDYAANKAISTFAVLIKMDSANSDYKVQQALCYIDGKNDVMSGVLELKDVEKTDPDNETMNLTLGKLAVVSGQYDKAIARLEKLIKMHPDNAEAYLRLSEAYKAVGRKGDAVKVLEKCKTLVQNEEAKKQIDQIINQINNS